MRCCIMVPSSLRCWGCGADVGMGPSSRPPHRPASPVQPNSSQCHPATPGQQPAHPGTLVYTERGGEWLRPAASPPASSQAPAPLAILTMPPSFPSEEIPQTCQCALVDVLTWGPEGCAHSFNEHPRRANLQQLLHASPLAGKCGAGQGRDLGLRRSIRSSGIAAAAEMAQVSSSSVCC